MTFLYYILVPIEFIKTMTHNRKLKCSNGDKYMN